MRSWLATQCSWRGCGFVCRKSQNGSSLLALHWIFNACLCFAQPSNQPCVSHVLSMLLFVPPPQNKVQAFWDITRHELGDARNELLTKDRDLEEEQVWPGGFF